MVAPRLQEAGAEAHTNTFYRHFYYFMREHQLMQVAWSHLHPICPGKGLRSPGAPQQQPVQGVKSAKTRPKRALDAIVMTIMTIQGCW